MGLFTKKDDKEKLLFKEFFHLTEDIGPLKAGNMVNVELFETKVLFYSKLMGTVSLDYSKIKQVEYKSETELIEKSKSMIGRAVIGNLVAGDKGSVVGAMTALKPKQKKERHIYLIITYNDNQTITFEDTRKYNGQKLANKLKELCNLTLNKEDYIL